MKSKFFLLGILCLSFIALCTTGRATTYSAGVQAGDEWILEVTLVDEEGLVAAFLNEQNWKMNVQDSVYHWTSTNDEMTNLGAQFKIRVDGVTESESESTLDITLWDWTMSGFSAGAIDSEWRVPKDPTDYYWGGPDTLFVGSPVNSYLAAMSVISIYEDDFEVQGNMAIHTPWEDISFEYTYDSTTGGWVGMSLVYNNEAVYTIGLSTADGNGDNGNGEDDANGILTRIPGYEISLLLGITSIISLGFAYMIKKKHRV